MDIFRLQVDLSGQLLLECHTPVQKTGLMQCVLVHREGRLSRTRVGRGETVKSTAIVEKVVEALTGKRTGNKHHIGRVIEGANPGGQFCVALLVENISPRQPRRQHWMTNDFIPVEAQAGLQQQTFSQGPAILTVAADFDIVQFTLRTNRKSRIARTRGRCRKTVWRGIWRHADPQEGHRVSLNPRIIGEAVEIDADLELMPSVPLARRERQVR